jgi:hypothetical protein
VDPDFLIATSVRQRPGEAVRVTVRDAAELNADC